MQRILKAEEAAQWVLTYVATLYLGFDWWLYFALLLLPDLSMIGYLAGPKVGAITYNLGHHKGLAVIIGFCGWYFTLPYVLLAGLVLFGHSAMDRIFGYGLKYSDDFKHTHLGWIGHDTAS